MTTTKVNLVNQMKRMIRCFIKLFFQSTVIYFKNFNAKTHPYIISLAPVHAKSNYCFLLLFPIADLIFILRYI